MNGKHLSKKYLFIIFYLSVNLLLINLPMDLQKNHINQKQIRKLLTMTSDGILVPH
jgi:hypothetical protein